MRLKLKINLENLEKRSVIVLSLIVFFISNLVVSQLPFRLDFSKNKFFSLSDSTKKILKEVDDVLKIKFYVSSKLPRRVVPLKQTVWDFLKEYKKQNKNIEVYLIDPEKDEKAGQEVREAGLTQLQFSELERDKFALSKSYFGIVVYYLNKREVIPNAINFENLEYELSTAIYRLVRKNLPKLAVLGYSNPFTDRDSPVSVFDQFLTKSFQLNYLKPEDLSDEYNLAIIFDNRQDSYATDSAKKIDKFLSKGKKGIFFVDGVWVKDNLSYEKAGHNLFEILSKRGINVNRDLVLSASSEIVNFGNQFISYVLPYPFWVKTDVFNKKAGYFSNIDALVFPWVSSLELKNKNGYKTSWLIKTRTKSWKQEEPFQLFPDNIIVPDKGFGDFVVAAQSEKGKEKVVVIASSRFSLSSFLRSNDNLGFVSNLALSLTSEGLLSGIRVKKPSIYLLPQLPSQQKDLIKYLSSLGLPFIFLAFGIFWILKRRN